MSRFLMSLYGVPEDELDEVHVLLQSQDIDYYETTGSAFGISAPGLWVREESQFAKARQLLDQYADERSRRVRQQRDAELAAGTARTFAGMFAEQPLRYTAYLLLVLALLYVATVQVWLSVR